MTSPTIREAQPQDAATILRFIRELAAYEREPDAVEVTESTLAAQLATEPPPFRAWIAELGGEPVGFMLTFPTYSTWKGRPGLWLEDFYVTPAARGRGVGAALFRVLGRHCRDLGYGRLELSALDWNGLALDFYRRRGARPMRGWTTWRFEGPTLEALAEG